MPSSRCSMVATSGMRLAPPTRNTPDNRSESKRDARITARVRRTARSSSGRVSDSSSSRVRRPSASSSGIGKSTLV
ncbi:MAG TPA: hypothetical protein VE172_22535 [Stackebrandtia sp.]|nr:hypothetical protein [Stackebrandtia sp.]HZE41587.1 hypothetical protein [Stackebrandtia sp.]